MNSISCSFARLALGCAAVLVLDAACTREMAVRPSRYDGDLTGLERVKGGPWDELYLRRGVDWAALEAVHIAGVELAEPVETRGERYRERDLSHVRRSFELILGQTLERCFPKVAEAGKGVVRIEATLTEVVANIDPDLAPGRNRSLGTGFAAMQLDVRESRGGELWIAIVDRYTGRDLEWNPQARFTWGDAEAAFRLWSQQLCGLLERKHEHTAS